MKIKVMVLLTLVVVTAVILWVRRPDDTRAIRKQWTTLLDLVQKDSSPGLLGAATQAQELQSFFTTGAVVQIGGPYPLFVRRPELPGLYHQAWSHLDRIEVRSRGEDITVSGDEARLEVTLDYDLSLRGERQKGLDAYRLYWVREEDTWRIRQVERLDTVRNPASHQAP